MKPAYSLEERVSRLEDRDQIRELAATYCLVIDNRDIDGIKDCFTEAGRFRSKDGVMDALGRQAVVDQFHGRYAALGPTLHYSHDHVIWLDDDNPDRAKGLVSSHAEVVRNQKPMLAAIRYEDQYERGLDGQWRFSDRLLWFFYYLDVRLYADNLGKLNRMIAYDDPTAADFPEQLASWQSYAANHPPDDNQ